METLRIGEVAGRAGVNVQTLRFYERRGLLPEPPRRASGYREYAPESVRRVRFIKRAQELGFTLAEVEELLRLREDPRIPCREVRATAETKIADIEEKMRRLRAMRAALAAEAILLCRMRGAGPWISCFVLLGYIVLRWLPERLFGTYTRGEGQPKPNS